jgi:spoIIIJ-associated protein
MKAFFGKLFGGGDKKEKDVVDIVGDVLQTIVDLSKLNIGFDVVQEENELKVDFYGEDEALLTEKEGILLDSFQLYLKRVLQHQLPDVNMNLVVDCDGFRESTNQSLIDLAEKLKGIAVSKGKPVYFRALPPRDRKVVHQYLAEDGRVKSRSVGDGLYKKIKIFPVKNETTPTRESASTTANS